MKLFVTALLINSLQSTFSEQIGPLDNQIEYFNAPKSSLLNSKTSLLLPILQNYNLVASEPSSSKFYNYLPFSNVANSDCACGLASTNPQRSPRTAKFEVQPNDGRVVGGTESTPHSLPWMALLMSQERDAPFCGGSIISNRYVLTAAHCYDSKMLIEDIKVVVGEHDRCRQDRVTTTFSVDKIIVHPSYRHSDFFADIMLLRLSMPMTFNRVVRPICLPQLGANFDNTWAVVSGWGTQNSTGSLQCALMQSSVPVISQQDCTVKSKYPPNAVHASLFCAGIIGQGGRDSCQGDSGGPLQVYNPRNWRSTLIGIVSNGIGCGLPEYPGLYTAVPKFIGWIASVTQDSSYCFR